MYCLERVNEKRRANQRNEGDYRVGRRNSTSVEQRFGQKRYGCQHTRGIPFRGQQQVQGNLYELQETDYCRHNNGGIYDLGIRSTEATPPAGRHRKGVYRRKRSWRVASRGKRTGTDF